MDRLFELLTVDRATLLQASMTVMVVGLWVVCVAGTTYSILSSKTGKRPKHAHHR